MYKTTPLVWHQFFGIKRGSSTRDFMVDTIHGGWKNLLGVDKPTWGWTNLLGGYTNPQGVDKPAGGVDKV